MLLATIVDTGALLDVVLASLVAVTAVTIAVSLSIVGATRFVDVRNDGRTLQAAAYAVMAVAGITVTLAAVVLGIVVMTSK